MKNNLATTGNCRLSFGGIGRVVLRVVIYNWSAVMGCENKMATWTGEREKKLVLFTWKRTDIGCKMGISLNE